jgi:hypothetical protein
MPCPVNELGGIAPFVETYKSKAKRLWRRGAWMVRRCLWRVRARHAVPLLPEKSENEQRERNGAKHRRWGRVFTLAQSSFSRAAYRRTPVLLKTLSPLGEGLVLGWRYRWCSRLTPVLLHWLWKTSASGRGKCGTYQVPWKMVRAGFSLKPTYYFAGLRFCVHLSQRGARRAAVFLRKLPGT